MTDAYSPRVDEALVLAAKAFRRIRRKGSGVPYLTHLLQVTATVGEFGGDEEQLIAALLHDYLEDIEGSSPEELEAKFGPRVRRLVEALSDTQVRPKPPWEERKAAYIAHLKDEPAEVKLICAADKLHNAQSIIRDHRRIGSAIWERFNPPRERVIWYYEAVLDALGQGWSHELLEELRAVVAVLPTLL